jgi:hypothetical protein
MPEPVVIVLTPVKNEEWILEQFLTVTSFFADSIIIADQNSTDLSKMICNNFPKVQVIENKAKEFNEAERQGLLIEAARNFFPDNKRILLALDADELLSSNCLYQNETWARIKSLEPGTTLYFEKPDILPGITECVRYPDNYFVIGYIDDGLKHESKVIHSKRVPEHNDKSPVRIEDIKVLHFAHSRKNIQSSKLRYYSVIENIKRTNPVYLRRKMYPCRYDESFFYSKRDFEKIPDEWLLGWQQKGIDLKNFNDPEYSWYDFEVLRLFNQWGSRRFYLDNIWCFDWEGCREVALLMNKEAPTEKIKYPGLLDKLEGSVIDNLYKLYKRFNRK